VVLREKRCGNGTITARHRSARAPCPSVRKAQPATFTNPPHLWTFMVQQKFAERNPVYCFDICEGSWGWAALRDDAGSSATDEVVRDPLRWTTIKRLRRSSPGCAKHRRGKVSEFDLHISDTTRFLNARYGRMHSRRPRATVYAPCTTPDLRPVAARGRVAAPALWKLKRPLSQPCDRKGFRSRHPPRRHADGPAARLSTHPVGGPCSELGRPGPPSGPSHSC
jgi:hypothetical protein